MGKQLSVIAYLNAFQNFLLKLIFLMNNFPRGHGTCMDDEGRICATVAGTVERINKLYSVKPQRSR